MESTELSALLSDEGMRLLDSLDPWQSNTDIVRAVARLRAAGHSADLVSAVLQQSRLRAKAVPKFGELATQMLFTAAGLEQATRMSVATLHATRYRGAGLTSVADLGCGIGADAIAIASAGLNVIAVDLDETTAAIAAHNLAPWPHARVRSEDATTTDLSGVDGVWLDPARRSADRRLNNPADWTPSLDFAFDLGRRLPTGVKLGPGIDRDLIPAGCEAQWISVDNEVVELGLWFGDLARPGIGRAALVLSSSGTAELTAATDSADVDAGHLGEYLFEPNGAVIRARLIGDLARSIGARMIDPHIAYLTADAPAMSPFASCFRVRAVFPFSEKVLKRELAARDIGVLEIKKRGVDVDPAVLRTRLALRGSAAATLVIARIGDRRIAVLAERVTIADPLTSRNAAQ